MILDILLNLIKNSDKYNLNVQNIFEFFNERSISLMFAKLSDDQDKTIKLSDDQANKRCSKNRKISYTKRDKTEFEF